MEREIRFESIKGAPTVLWQVWPYRAFTDLDNLNFDCGGLVLGYIEPIFDTVPAPSKNVYNFKSGQKWLENNHLAWLV